MLRGLNPVKDLFNVALLNGEVIAVAHGGFEQHANGVGQFLNPLVTQSWKLVKCVFLASMLDRGLDVTVERIGLR